MPELSWLATEMLTGRIFADLPDLDVPRVKRTIGRYEPAQGSLPLPTAPEDWERVLTPGATCFHLMRPNPGGGLSIPQWGGYITEDPLDESDTVEFPMATIEAYLDRRYVGNKTFTGVGQNLIVQDLIESYVADGPNGGIPIRVEIVNGGDGQLRDRSWTDQDDKTIYSILTDFMGVQGGPEWTIGMERLHNPERITWVFYVGDRVGTPVTPGLGPAAVFEMPGAVTSFRRHRSYTKGKGANVVMAYSSGQGEVRPQSAPVVTPDVLRPTFEHRWTPSSSIKEIATLDEHAQAAAPQLARGALSIQLSAAALAAPVLESDWALGDDIGFKIGGTFRPGASTLGAPGVMVLDDEGLLIASPDLVAVEDGLLSSGALTLDGEGLYVYSEPRQLPDRPVVPAFPRGIRGTARAIGVEIELGGTPIITPILAGGEIWEELT